MKQTILAFGDSNTHGTPPMDSHDHHPRLARRWPVVMADILGCTLIEDGLPGRTACQITASDPDLHRDGHLGLRISLNAHGPIDRLIIMLGTNDLQAKYGKTADAIAAGIAGLLRMANDAETQARHDGFAITLVCPPPIEEAGAFVPELFGGAAKSRALLPRLQELAAQWGAGFIDAGAHIAVHPKDGTHFDADAHDTLGKAIAAALQ
ncbi:Lysophospholipase L1 [Cognatiyoonia koreensis]|uniref:Lysophospholipase L1 n=1 Tax=Cognatiyoonia koreensis TaxID=364200 RepID=A0A1I0RWG1_9RHOB|nr:GDSL-type esterase/lipase family protein [Cognatiyoonia koreensis]SEW45725.1 Lysophospholipase L1 [Cognatiyoonia koreensis]